MTIPMPTTIEAALIQSMKDEASINDEVEGRIHPVRNIAASAGKKRIVVRRISGPRFMTLNGPSGLANPRIQVQCWAPQYTEAKSLAALVRLWLDGFRGDMSGITVNALEIEDDIDVDEPSAGLDQQADYGVSMDALFLHQETINVLRVES